MNHYILEDGPKYIGPYYNNEEDLQPTVMKEARKIYSAELCDLAERCVRFRYQERINVQDLYDEI